MVTYIDEIVEKVMNECKIKSRDLAKLYALLVLTKGNSITLKDVHDAWALNMNYRPTTDKCFGHDHKSIVPFNELSVESQNKDQRFVNSLIKIANSMR